MPSGISPNPLNPLSQIYLDQISEAKLKQLEKASALSASDNPADQDKAREIRVRHDYESLKKQIGSKKRPTKPACNEESVGEGVTAKYKGKSYKLLPGKVREKLSGKGGLDGDYRDEIGKAKDWVTDKLKLTNTKKDGVKTPRGHQDYSEGFSDWRTDLDLREITNDAKVVDDDGDEEPEIKEKKVKNKIKINPTFKENAEEFAKNLGGQLLEVAEVVDNDEDEDGEPGDDKKVEQMKKKEAMLKKRIVRMKMMAVNQTGGEGIIASYEPDIEGAVEYFYEEGLNEEGIDQLIEEIGIEEFVNFVDESAVELNEERAARRATVRAKKYDVVKKEVDKADAARRKSKKGEYAPSYSKKETDVTVYDDKPSAKKKAPVKKAPVKKSKKDYDGDGKKETPKAEHRGVRNKKITKAVAKVKKTQPAKKATKQGLGDKIRSAYKAGVKRHRKATQVPRVFAKGVAAGAKKAVKFAKDVKKVVSEEELLDEDTTRITKGRWVDKKGRSHKFAVTTHTGDEGHVGSIVKSQYPAKRVVITGQSVGKKKKVESKKTTAKKKKSKKVEEQRLAEAERKLADRLARKRKLYDKTTKKAMQYARDEGEAAGHARYRMSSISREMDKLKDKMKKEEVVIERLGGKGYKPYTSLTGKKVSGDWEDSDRGAGNKAKKRAGGTVKKKSPTYQAYVLNKEENVFKAAMKKVLKKKNQERKPAKAMDAGARAKRVLQRKEYASKVSGSTENVPDDIRDGYEATKRGEVLSAFKRDPKVRKRFEKAAKKEGGPGSAKNRAADDMLQTAKNIAKRKGDTSKSDDRYAYEEVQTEAKVDQGRSDYGKASIRNYRSKGPGYGEPAMFDPENKRGKLIDKRREEHKARRGVKGAKVPAYKVSEEKKKGLDGKACWKGYRLAGTKKKGGKTVDNCVKEEDKAFNYVVAKLRKQHGKDAVITKDSPKPKPPSAAQKAKASAERKKRQDADNKAYASRAKKAGFKSTQDYTDVVARYGSEDNYKKGKGLGT